MSEVNPVYWGDSSTWLTGSNGGYKIPTTDHEIYDQYYTPDSPQPLGEPTDISPALWGWNKDCSWATKHVLSWVNGVRDEAFCRPSVNDPVMGWVYATTTSSNSSYFRGAPNYRFNYDTYGDYGEHANYSEAHAVEQIRSVCGPSYPWMSVEWGSWCFAPMISVYKFDSTNGWMTLSLTLSGLVDNHDLEWYLANGWTPYSISTGDLYGAGVGTGGSLNERTSPDIIGQGKTFLSGMGNLKLPQTMYDWYSSHAPVWDMEGKYYIQPDYGHDLEIGQAPMTPWCADRLLTFDNDASDVYDCDVMCIGGHYAPNITVWQQNDNMAFLKYAHTPQVFDDVSYHWEWMETDDTGASIDPSSTSGTVHLFTKLVIDSKAEGMTEAEAMYGAILHECAFFGFKFANLEHRAKLDDITSAGTGLGLYLPLFDSNGATTGLYKTGQEMVDDPTVDADSIDFNPNPPPIPPEGGGEAIPSGRTGYWDYTFSNFSVINNKQYYVLNAQQYADFMEFCQGSYWTTDADPVNPGQGRQVVHSNLEWNGVDCSSWITCVKQYPFDIPQTNEMYPIKVGFIEAKVDDGQGGETIIGAPLHLYNTNDCTYRLGKINMSYPTVLPSQDFRSTALTRVFVTLPFYGDFELDLAKYYGGQFEVRLIVDFVTGVGCYMMLSDGVLFDTVDVQIGMSLPLTAYDMGTYQNTMQRFDLAEQQSRQRAAYGVAQAAGSFIGGIITGNPDLISRGIISGANNVFQGKQEVEQAKFNLTHTIPRGTSASTASPFCSMVRDLTVTLKVMSPMETIGFGGNSDYSMQRDYGKTIGYACVKSGNLGTFSGLTVCSGANLTEISCTGAERQMLASALNSGVIV